MGLKTVFIGNGINFFSDKKMKWKDLLVDLMQTNKFDLDGLPYAMAYEQIRLSWQRENNQENSSQLKEYIADKLKDYPSNKMCKKILDSGFSNYITTNYDTTIENSFLDMNDGNFLEGNNQEEKYYSIRRSVSLKNNKKIVVGKVWHIHGEINPSKSIMLGFNHYIGSAAKVDSYIKGTYKSDSDKTIKKITKMEDKIESNSYDNLSWIELFFNTDVHIVGFSFDFYEIDLWNILTKRARFKSLSNNIYYYTKLLSQVSESDKDIEMRKRELLRNLSVEIIEVPLCKKSDENKDDYEAQWNKFIDLMREK